MSSSPHRLLTESGMELASNLEVADSVWRRFMGLMGRPDLPEGSGLCIRPCSSIHMFFMRFPIDVAFIDGDGRVVRAYHGIKPWRTTRVVFGAKAALELPAGTLARAGVREGSRISVV